MAPVAKPIQERLDEILARTKERNGCLIWQGPLDEKGYGYIKHNGKRMRVHRFVALYSRGKTTEQIAKLSRFRIEWTCGISICLNTNHMKFTASKPEKKYVDLVMPELEGFLASHT